MNPEPRGAGDWLRLIRELPAPGRRVRLMNVCGGHERTLSMAGLRRALPRWLELIPGPGCPVCVCPQQDIARAIRLALRRELTLVSFGDMLRVPVDGPKKTPRSLTQARAAGADVRAVASPDQVVALAERLAPRPVVFFAAGFETTTAPLAAMLAAGVPDNLYLLLAGRRTWPAVAMLLDHGVAFDALIAPGHVATVMGPEEWGFVVGRHRLPTAVAGFTPAALLSAVYTLLRQLLDGRCALVNCYPEVVRPGGNPVARRLLAQALQVSAARWRGIGRIDASGYTLRGAYVRHDARRRFPEPRAAAEARRDMPPGCDCARVVLGQIYPNDCVLYGRACTPRAPVGPCMVSDEGACRIWWAAGERPPAQRLRAANRSVVS